jgi:hypothetical protein
MKTKLAIIALAAISLGACATPPTWTKAGGTADAFEADKFQCEATMRQSYPFAGVSLSYTLVNAADMIDFGKRCLRSKGWRQVEVKPTAPANAPAPIDRDPVVAGGETSR